MAPLFDFTNKNILVTGASRGLGQVCVMSLAEHGANVALVARNAEALEEVKAQCAHSECHFVMPADLANIDAAQNLVGRVLKFFNGHIDCILHVAGGGLGLRDPLITCGDLERLFMLNVKAAVEINRYVAPAMIKRGKGNLVHIGSLASSEAVGSVGYNTVKAALAAYVRSLGRELAGSGVVVTGILPGGFYAPENAMQRLEENKPEIYKQFIEERLPRKVMGKAEELIPLILFLCSDKASMMGGCLVPIDAGEGRAYIS